MSLSLKGLRVGSLSIRSNSDSFVFVLLFSQQLQGSGMAVPYQRDIKSQILVWVQGKEVGWALQPAFYKDIEVNLV